MVLAIEKRDALPLDAGSRKRRLLQGIWREGGKGSKKSGVVYEVKVGRGGGRLRKGKG